MEDAKSQLRARHLSSRARLRTQPERKARLDAALVDVTVACIAHFGATNQPIAAYTPLASEPGPADFPARLAPAASVVWLPLALPGGELAWAEATGTITAMRTGALGIREPSGARFNSNVLRACSLVIAPALGVDTSGMRLGKGMGYYDRALSGLQVPVAAVVFDDEFVASIPHEAHDIPVAAVITPSGFHVLEGTA